MIYVRASRLKEVKRAMDAFSRYWGLGVKLSRFNLEAVGLRKKRRDVREKDLQVRFFDYYVYERHIPSDHELVRIQREIDFSFVEEETRDLYEEVMGDLLGL